MKKSIPKKKRFPSEEEIQKGIIDRTAQGGNYKGYISFVGGTYYSGCESQELGKLLWVGRAKDFREALVDAAKYAF
jgi:hypothetical protein